MKLGRMGDKTGRWMQ